MSKRKIQNAKRIKNGKYSIPKPSSRVTPSAKSVTCMGIGCNNPPREPGKGFCSYHYQKAMEVLNKYDLP